MEGARVPRRDDRALRRPQVRTATEEPRSPAPREPSPAAPRRPNMRRNARMFRGRGRAGVRQFLATTRRSPRPCGTQLRTCPPDDRARVFRRHRSDGAGGRSRGPHRDPKRLPKPRSIRARPGGGTARALSTRFPAGEARRATARRAGAGGRARVGIYHSAMRHRTAAEVGEFLRDDAASSLAGCPALCAVVRRDDGARHRVGARPARCLARPVSSTVVDLRQHSLPVVIHTRGMPVRFRSPRQARSSARRRAVPSVHTQGRR